MEVVFPVSQFPDVAHSQVLQLPAQGSPGDVVGDSDVV